MPVQELDKMNDRSSWTPERLAGASRNVGLVILGGVALGLFASASNIYYVAALVIGALLILLTAWQFEAALSIYMLVAFIPWGRTPDLAMGGSGVGKGVYISQVMLGFLLVVWFGRYLTGKLAKRRISTGFYVPIALYIAYCIVNVVHSYLFWDPHVNRIHQHPSVNVIELALRLLSVGALVMAATTVSNARWLRYTTVAVMVPGIYSAANSLLGNVIPITAPWWPLLTFFSASFFLAVAMKSTTKMLYRVLCGVGVSLIVFIIFYRSVAWVSGWFGLFVSLATVAFLISRKAVVVGLLVVGLLTVICWSFINHNVIKSSQEEGDYDRFSLMMGAWKYATNFPLGVGLGNYRSYNSFYYGEKWGTTAYTSAHGTYSQLLSETGIPGFILFVGILVSGFGWMLNHYRKGMNSPGSQMFLLAALGQMAGIAAAAIIGDYIMPTYHNGGLTTFSVTVYSWLIWGLAVAHVRLDEAVK